MLRDAGHLTVSLVAEVDGVVVGHIAFSPVTMGNRAQGLGLAPLAVVDSHRGQGVGGELIEQGIRACGFLGVGWIVVLGDPACYERFGFRPASTVGLSDEYGGGAAFQVMEITPGALPVGGGLVHYGPEFAEVG